MGKRETGMLKAEISAGMAGETLKAAEVFATKGELALYIADITLQMRNLAKEAKLSFLAYLLEMAFQEAFDIASNEENIPAGADGDR
jgi:hypothetical protein